MKIQAVQLTLELTERSPEIGRWLGQFPSNRQATATDLLLKLQFIRRDVFAEWLKEQLTTISGGPCACYAVRKFDDSDKSYWSLEGTAAVRPPDSLGSEDLVQSVLANLLKTNEHNLLDHPSLQELKTRRVRKVVLIDDSLGSGARVATFVSRFMKNKTILSWWSFGLISFYILTFTRTRTAEKRILSELPGVKDPMRMNRKSEKLCFISHYHFDDEGLEVRWGSNATQTSNLCDSVDAIPNVLQRGYGGVMSKPDIFPQCSHNTPWYLME